MRLSWEVRDPQERVPRLALERGAARPARRRALRARGGEAQRRTPRARLGTTRCTRAPRGARRAPCSSGEGSASPRATRGSPRTCKPREAGVRLTWGAGWGGRQRRGQGGVEVTDDASGRGGQGGGGGSRVGGDKRLAVGAREARRRAERGPRARHLVEGCRLLRPRRARAAPVSARRGAGRCAQGARRPPRARAGGLALELFSEFLKRWRRQSAGGAGGGGVRRGRGRGRAGHRVLRGVARGAEALAARDGGGDGQPHLLPLRDVSS